MVPIKPVEMGLELLWEGIKEATWRERYEATKFFLIEIPVGILVELFHWGVEKVNGPALPEHWLDAERGIIHTPKPNPSDLGNNTPRYH